MLTNTGELCKYLEVVGDAKPVTIPAAPCIAIPTTAGTGAEVTRNAVLGVPEHKVKVSIRSPLMIPRLAVVDPVLTHSLPPALTASTGLDALTQLIEAFVCTRANPLTDGFCREGFSRIARSLRRAYANGEDAAAREDMTLASLLSGLALANAGLGAVHGLAAALGAMIPASHGAICGRLLPYVIEANIQALQGRQTDSPALLRYGEAARLLTGVPTVRATNLIRWTYELCAELKTQPLADFGLKEQDFVPVAAKAGGASSMKANPIQLTQEELIEILRRATNPVGLSSAAELLR
jgi:alcohol dehydrogenase class IV